jgi:hypothetical protein
MKDVILDSVITCPRCGFARREAMPGRRLPVLLRLCRVRRAAAPEGRRLLRVLLVRLGALRAEACGGYFVRRG